VVMVQFLQPFRPDSLSIPALFVRMGLPEPPVWLAFAGMGVAVHFSLRRLGRSPSGFVLSLAVMFLAFFSLNKQAFLNYYFLVGACLCMAIAAADKVENGLPSPTASQESQ
jgi:4-amino-4-deoxy-L-arabinose transferase-like glycosyltransferase